MSSDTFTLFQFQIHEFYDVVPSLSLRNNFYALQTFCHPEKISKLCFILKLTNNTEDLHSLIDKYKRIMT